MLTEGSGGLSDRAILIVATSLAARQWEAVLAAPEIASGTSAWLTPAVMSYRAWTEGLWLDGDASRPVPLGAAQALALWRRVIAESAESAELIGHRGAAEWAADAWQRLCHWRIDPRAERAGPDQHDYRAFLGWCTRYRAVLADRGWIDEPGLDLELSAAELPRTPAEWVLADIDESPPARRALLEHAARAGIRVSRWVPPPFPPSGTGPARRVRLSDAADELKTAVAWANERLAAAPTSRIAIVVAGLAERHVEVERALADLPSGAITWVRGQPLGAHALLGAALTGIELTTPGASFATFSRWLRSPFFGAQEPAARGLRARLEARLRGDVRSKVPFGVAYLRTGLAESLRHEAPDVAAAVAAALDEVGETRRATATQWARLWQRALRCLDWLAPAERDASARHWQAALDELARLTAVLGPVSPGAALAELERILDRSEAPVLPLAGIHVLERIEEVGPGYAGAWLTGFTDTHWPQAARPNPLLPRALQRAHGMPWCSPADADRRCAQSLERLLRCVPEVVASWPSRVYDYETEPSPALWSWPELTGAELEGLVRPRGSPAQRTRESLVDAAPPLVGIDVPGGTGVLTRQARCPLRAFAEYRLGARELEQRSQGLTPRQRGIVTHTALELLLIDRPSQSELGARRDAIAGCVTRALDRLFQDAREALRPLYELERERLGAVLEKLLAIDAERAPFEIVAIEEKREVVVAGRRLRARVDRLDRLADGRVAVIDHKTGKEAGPGPWLKQRPRDLQVPFYAAYSPEPVAAAAIARLHGRDATYVGIWPPGTFPTRPSTPPDGRGWPERLELWRRQIEGLIRELVAGDTRLLLDDLDDAGGPFAPLSRVAEQVALARGALQRW